MLPRGPEAAPPVDGAANDELLDLLAKALGVPRSGVRLVHGKSSRVKRVEVDRLGAEDVRARLAGRGPDGVEWSDRSPVGG
jgi:uncharacterized protein YggU (UPF0235/DUF167 family)